MKRQTKFKETEIGIVPEDWEIKELSSVVECRTGKLDSNQAEERGIYPFFTCAPDPLRINKCAFDCTAILLAGNNANGIFHMNFYSGKFNAYQRTYVITPMSEKAISLKFLYYQLNLRLNYLKEISQGTATKFLTIRILNNLKIAYPELYEQEHIADILSVLDSKIVVNQHMNATLEAIGQALFKHWFIDFEFPNEEDKPYKSSGGEMVDSEFGEIPKGWEAKPLDGVADFLNGLALQKFPPESEEYLPVIKIRELRQGVTESSDRASNNIERQYVVENGDVLFSWSGSLEVVIWCGGKGALNQHLFKVTSKEFPKWFFYYWIKEHLPSFQHIAAGKATTMGHIQRYHLSQALTVVPPKQLLFRLDEVIAPIFNSYVKNGVESRYLAQIRDSLLPRLMSGKIKVSMEASS